MIGIVLFVSAISGTLITFTEGRHVCHTSTYNFTIVQNLQVADAKSTRRLLTGEVADKWSVSVEQGVREDYSQEKLQISGQ